VQNPFKLYNFSFVGGGDTRGVKREPEAVTKTARVRARESTHCTSPAKKIKTKTKTIKSQTNKSIDSKHKKSAKTAKTKKPKDIKAKRHKDKKTAKTEKRRQTQATFDCRPCTANQYNCTNTHIDTIANCWAHTDTHKCGQNFRWLLEV